MAAKYQQDQVQGYPLAPSSVVPRSDEEYAHNYQSEEQMKKKKRMKCFAYIAIFAIFQVIVILVFSLTVMRVKAPKVRLGDIAVTNDPSGDVRFAARVRVKNTNFGHYKFDNTYATVKSANNNNNNNVGQFLISEGRARARSTKKIAVIWDLRSSNASSGTMDLIVEAKLRGKVELMKVIKRKKSADMNCTMTVNLATNVVQNLRCK